MTADLRQVKEAIERAIPSAAVVVTLPSAGGQVGTDFAVSLDLKGMHLALAVAWVDSSSTAILARRLDRLRDSRLTQSDVIPALMASYFTPSQRARLTEAGMAYVDMEGNAWIESTGVYVNRVSPRVPARHALSATNPFSDKASLVVRHLITSHSAVGVRELSSIIGLSPGYVSKVLSRMETLGYLRRQANKKVVVRDPRSLLQDWASSYNYSKNRITGYFCKARSATDIVELFRARSTHTDCALTAQAGAYLVAPFAAFDRVDVYSGGPSATTELVSRLDLEPVERGANVFVWMPYYKYSVFYGRRELQGIPVVSDVQLYLDLLKYPLRGAEQAQHLYETVLGPIVGRDG